MGGRSSGALYPRCFLDTAEEPLAEGEGDRPEGGYELDQGVKNAQ